MQERFSISHNGQEVGPFSKDEILQKVKANELTALDFIFVEGKNDWVPLLEFLPGATGARPLDTRPPGGGPHAKQNAPPPSKPLAPMKSPLLGAQKPQTAPPAQAKPTAPTVPATVAALSPATLAPAQSIVPLKSLPAVVQQAAPLELAAAAPKIQTQPQVAPETKPVTKPEMKVEAKKGTISLKGGVGTLELLQYTAGTVRLALLDEKSLGLSLGKPEDLVVKAAAASKIVLKGPSELTAGQGAAITIEAHDKWGNRDSGYNGSVTAMLSNGTAVGEIKIASGRGTIHFTSTKAETVTVKLVDTARTGLDVSSAWEIQYVAGPAARLIIVTPDETVAGQPIKVEVKALDQFGNLATACNDSVHLEVSAAVKTQAPVKRHAS